MEKFIRFTPPPNCGLDCMGIHFIQVTDNEEVVEQFIRLNSDSEGFLVDEGTTYTFYEIQTMPRAYIYHTSSPPLMSLAQCYARRGCDHTGGEPKIM